MQGGETLQYKVGLINHKNKYLTAEVFGNKINASGTGMRKKQLWVVEQDSAQEGVVYLKSSLNRYLAADKNGNVTADSEEVSEVCKFRITYDKDGKWEFQNVSNTYYLEATDDNVRCYEKAANKSCAWTVRLAVHPQVNLRNVNRKTYVHLGSLGKLQCNEMIPWGKDALITLEFKDGSYYIRACDGTYLNKDGSLSAQTNGNDCEFKLELKPQGIVFKDNENKYLMGVGRDAVLQSTGKGVAKDTYFTLEDSHPQVYITAHNGKKVSTQQGRDLTANQEQLTDKETFQMEFDKDSGNWRFRGENSRYWSLEDASGIQAVGNNCFAQTLFTVDWLKNGYVSLKASNGKYLHARSNGSLFAVRDAVGDNEQYTITVMNRPLLVLMCDYGFVGCKSGSSQRIECNRTTPDYFRMEACGRGQYQLKGQNDKYWTLDTQSNINADGDEPFAFSLEMRAQSRFAIKAPNGNYIKGEQNGIFAATATDVSKATLWEY